MAATAGGAKSVFREVGLHGGAVGTVALKEDRVEWRDASGKNSKEFLKSDVTALNWTLFGQKGHLKVALKEGKSAKFDGFHKDDFDALADFFIKNFEIELEKEKVSRATVLVFLFSKLLANCSCSPPTPPSLPLPR